MFIASLRFEDIPYILFVVIILAAVLLGYNFFIREKRAKKKK